MKVSSLFVLGSLKNYTDLKLTIIVMIIIVAAVIKKIQYSLKAEPRF